MSNNNNKQSSSTNKASSPNKTDDVNILLSRIDEQNEQLNRLQSKFRDVTHAYKSLLAEKQALEITLKALKTNTSLANEIKKSANQQEASRSASASDISDNEKTTN